MRRPGPDVAKGVLLALVVWGHTHAAGVGDDLGKWALYGFHMPAFLFVSGWLLNLDRLVATDWRGMAVAWWQRMVRQWLAVLVVWAFLFARPDGLEAAVRLLTAPPFHLWYVPALVVALSVLKQLPLRVALVVTLAAAVVWGTPLKASVPTPDGLDWRYLAYPFWVVLGTATRRGVVRPHPGLLAAGVVGVAGWIGGYVAGERWVIDVGFLLLNLSTVVVVPAAIDAADRWRAPVAEILATVGRHSLWIYLLHPFATRWVVRVDDGGLEGRLVGAVATALIVLAGAGWYGRAPSSPRREQVAAG